MIQKAITMNSKGAFTLPAKVRRELGLSEAGQKLMLTYHPNAKTIELNTAPSFKILRSKFKPLINKNFDVETTREERRQQKAQKYL